LGAILYSTLPEWLPIAAASPTSAPKMASATIEQRNQEATCYCGNLDEQVTEEVLWELMLQAGPVVNVFIPKDKVTSRAQVFCCIYKNT
jgi:RNA recognition motif-containing protein